MPGATVCYTHGLPAGKRQPQAGRLTRDHADLVRRLTAAGSPAELAQVLAEVAGLTLSGALPAKTAAVIGQLGKAALEALKQARSDRLKEIEEHLAKHPTLGGRKARR